METVKETIAKSERLQKILEKSKRKRYRLLNKNWEYCETSVLTAEENEKVVPRKEEVTKYRYYSCMFWSDSTKQIVSGSEKVAQQNTKAWNGEYLRETTWREIGESVCLGVFVTGVKGTSNGTYVKVVTDWYESPQNPMPSCIEDSPCFNEEITKDDVIYYQKWRLVYKEQ